MRTKLTLLISSLSLLLATGQNVEILHPFDYATNYQDVFVATGGKGFAVGTCGVLATTDNGIDWTVGTPPDAEVEFEMVACAPGTNCQDVWLGADEVLYHSTDGGQNWSRVPFSGLYGPREIHFLSASVLLLSHSSVSVWRSTDGGQNWTEISLGGSYREAATFVNPNLGFILDQTNFNILRSTDLGASWDSITHLEERPLYLDMVDSHIGYMIVDRQKLVKTTDGGFTWTTVQDRVNASPRIIVAFDENNLMLSSFPSSLVFSTDGGQTWDNTPQPLEEDAYGLRLNGLHRNGQEAWIASDASAILYSADQLATRTNLFPADRQTIESIQFVDSNTGYALCERRGFFKTIDGGDSWERVTTDFATVSRDMLVRSATEVIIPYNSSGPQRTTDGGRTWSPLLPAEIADTVGLFQVEQLPSGRLYLMGSVHAVYSDDDGQTWNVVYHGLGGFADMLYFYDDQLGFFGGQGGRLARTTDGGASWTSILQGDLTNQPIRNLYMRDANNGFINISSTTYCTNDGGLTWDSNNCAGYDPPGLVVAAPNGDLFSTSSSGNTQTIFRSSDQGLNWALIQTYCSRSNRFLSVTPDNGYLYGGWSGGIITRLDLNITATQEPEPLPEPLLVYPNPSTGYAQILLPAAIVGQDIDLRVFSAHGQLLLQQRVNAQPQLPLVLDELGAGFYFLDIRGTHFRGQAKLLKH
ncbi:MAG: hypothetical protein D6772_11540 [Bacteroidetes bacterium]|nr:MAG: hypothetical protein D6772_11540 [Bacteroidota bacterium]